MGRVAAIAIGIVVLVGACSPSAPIGIAGTWYDRAGHALPGGVAHAPLVLHVELGPDHCDLGSVVILDLAWPAGTPASFPDGLVYQYLRDPDGHFSEAMQRGFNGSARLPAGATDTGFHRGQWHLWVDQSDPGAVYVVGPGVTERWPRNLQRVGCA